MQSSEEQSRAEQPRQGKANESGQRESSLRGWGHSGGMGKTMEGREAGTVFETRQRQRELNGKRWRIRFQVGGKKRFSRTLWRSLVSVLLLYLSPLPTAHK